MRRQATGGPLPDDPASRLAVGPVTTELGSEVTSDPGVGGPTGGYTTAMGSLQHCTIHGHEVGYRLMGDEPDEPDRETILLIHGMAGSSRTWRDVHAGPRPPVPGAGPRPARPRRVGQADGRLLASGPTPAACATSWPASASSGPPSSASPSAVGSPCSSPISTPSCASASSWSSSGGLGREVSWILRMLSLPGQRARAAHRRAGRRPRPGQRGQPWLEGCGDADGRHHSPTNARFGLRVDPGPLRATLGPSPTVGDHEPHPVEHAYADEACGSRTSGVGHPTLERSRARPTCPRSWRPGRAVDLRSQLGERVSRSGAGRDRRCCRFFSAWYSSMPSGPCARPSR